MSYIRARSYLRWRMCFLRKTWPASIARRLAAMRCYRINPERNKQAERKIWKKLYFASNSIFIWNVTRTRKEIRSLVEFLYIWKFALFEWDS